jgi:hypothetical protein
VSEAAQLELGQSSPVASPTGLTAGAMTKMLRRHYLPEGRYPGGVFAPEIGSPDGRRRADLIWMPTTTAGGSGLHGHEVKVTRSDVLVELAEPAKAEPWAQFCTRWWLVVAHPALVEGLDIPAAWGVMAPPSGRRTRTMTVVKPAPALKPKDPAPGFERLAAWMMHGGYGEVEQMRRDLDYANRERLRLRAEVDRLQVAGGARDSPHAVKVSQILSAVEAGKTDFKLWDQVDPALVVTAILDAAATQAAAQAVRDEISSLVGGVQRLTEPFTYALKKLQTAERAANRLADQNGGSRA